MNRIVDTCPLTKFEGGLNLLHEANDDAVIRLESTAIAALAKYNRVVSTAEVVGERLTQRSAKSRGRRER